MNFNMNLNTLTTTDLRGKKVLLRVAYDITLQAAGDQFIVPDDGRIRATVPTINYLLAQDCSIILLSWLGRPTPGLIEEQYKMDPVAAKLAELIGRPVKKLDATVGAQVTEEIAKLRPGDILMLENTRFLVGENEADPQLGAELAALGEYVVWEAFAQGHRVHASTTGLLEHSQGKCCAGLLMEKEVSILQGLLLNPQPPFVLLLGGAKVSDKSGLLYTMISKVEVVLLGGALANPFLKAAGYNIGVSLIESVYVDQAKGTKFDAVAVASELLKDQGDKIKLPLDVVVASKSADGSFDKNSIRIVEIGQNKDLCVGAEMILDIGPATRKLYESIIAAAGTIFWNGPMGLFENSDFAAGSLAIARAVAASPGFSVVGGGDTEGVVRMAGLSQAYDHLSTGGGASLSFLSGEELPVLKYLYK